MKKLFYLLLLVTISVTITNCTKDIVAANITKQTVNILAPGDGIHTPYNAVTFWWDEIQDADKYELQIVSPFFSNVVKVITDTNVTINKFTMTLNPGTYQWRVRAINNSGNTNFSTRSFVIDSTTNLATVTVALISPSDSNYTNKLSQIFTWNSVPNATNYDIEIDQAGASIAHSTVTTPTFSYTFTQTANTNALYTWKVRASNSFSNSGYTTRTLFLNLALPAKPTALYPLPTTSVTPNFANKDSMLWSTVPAGSGDYDSLFVLSTLTANDTTLSNTKLSVKCSNHYYKLQPADSSGASKWFIRGGNYYYYWRLSRTDKAGNNSGYTPFKLFRAN